MKKNLFITVFYLLINLYSVTFASTSLFGDKGFINTPSSEVLTEKNINLGFSYLPQGKSYVDTKFSNNIYSISIGLIPRIEIGINFTEVFDGKLDVDHPYLTGSWSDKNTFLRIQLLKDKGFFPSAVLGGRDIISNRAVNLGGRGLSSHQQIFYIVLGKQLFDFKTSLGYSYAPEIPFGFVHNTRAINTINRDFRVNGFFCAVETPKIFSLASFIVEYDSKYFNYGLDIGSIFGLNLKVSMVDLKYFTARLGYEIEL